MDYLLVFDNCNKQNKYDNKLDNFKTRMQGSRK